MISVELYQVVFKYTLVFMTNHQCVNSIQNNFNPTHLQGDPYIFSLFLQANVMIGPLISRRLATSVDGWHIRRWMATSGDGWHIRQRMATSGYGQPHQVMDGHIRRRTATSGNGWHIRQRMATSGDGWPHQVTDGTSANGWPHKATDGHIR